MTLLNRHDDSYSIVRLDALYPVIYETDASSTCVLRADVHVYFCYGLFFSKLPRTEISLAKISRCNWSSSRHLRLSVGFESFSPTSFIIWTGTSVVEESSSSLGQIQNSMSSSRISYISWRHDLHARLQSWDRRVLVYRVSSTSCIIYRPSRSVLQWYLSRTASRRLTRIESFMLSSLSLSHSARRERLTWRLCKYFTSSLKDDSELEFESRTVCWSVMRIRLRWKEDVPRSWVLKWWWIWKIESERTIRVISCSSRLFETDTGVRVEIVYQYPTRCDQSKDLTSVSRRTRRGRCIMTGFIT